MRVILSLTFLALCSLTVLAGPTYTDPEKTDADFAYQGEYTGNVKIDDEDRKVGVQVIALGKGKFRAVAHQGGLPGDGWADSDKHTVDGELKDGAVMFGKDDINGTVKGGKLTIVAG